MLHLRRRKDEILEDCRALQERLRDFTTNLQNQFEDRLSADSSNADSPWIFFRTGFRSLEHSLNTGLREARRVHTRFRQEFAILVDVSLASESADEYRRLNRQLIGTAVTGSPIGNYNILLIEIESTIDQIDHFMMEVRAAEEIVPESDAKPVDLGVVIPLKEEFDVFREFISTKKPIRKNDRYYHPCDLEGPEGESKSCVVTMIGDMGPTRSAVVTSELLRFYKPSVVVMLGIAGSVSNDLLLGDVVVAKGIDDYAGSAKTVETEGGFEIVAGGPIFTPTKSIVELAKNFEYVSEEAYKKWVSQGASFLSESGVSITQRKARSEPKLAVEVVGSGSYVSASKSFNKLLREHRNREIKCIEMESGGLMNTIHQFSELKSMVVRGISDHADDEKASLEADTGEFFRGYAMRNVVAFFKEIVAVPDFWNQS